MTSPPIREGPHEKGYMAALAAHVKLYGSVDETTLHLVAFPPGMTTKPHDAARVSPRSSRAGTSTTRANKTILDKTSSPTEPARRAEPAPVAARDGRLARCRWHGRLRRAPVVRRDARW